MLESNRSTKIYLKPILKVQKFEILLAKVESQKIVNLSSEGDFFYQWNLNHLKRN